MKRFSRAGSTFATVITAAVVIAVAGTGGAVAGGLITSAKIKNNTIKSIDVRNGTLTGVDVADNGLTGADIGDFSLSNRDIGVLTATVNTDGTLQNSSGGVTATKLGTGTYEIGFGRDIRACAFLATIADPTTGSEAGQINVADRSGNANAVYVNTRTNDGSTSEDHSFHLAVIC